MTNTNTKIASITKMKLRKGVPESGIERSTWGDLTDKQIAEASKRLDQLRVEKARLTLDINDYKASIADCRSHMAP